MDSVLIIANSGRMLAQAACDINLKPVVIDCFADSDTQTLARDFYQVESLAIKDIQAIIESLKGEFKYCLYGSGFEAHQDSLYFLAEHFRLLGNTPEVFAALHDKRDFFQRLEQLDINFPAVYFNTKTSNRSHAPVWECSLSRSSGESKYLKKPFNSQGGLNIQLIEEPDNIKDDNHYYQQYIDGQALSALFIANNKQAEIIGFNQQWTIALSSQQQFVFSGIINHAELSVHHQQTLQRWVNKLTQSYGLRGLGSLDFILYRNECYVLEINPRPPASMQLYHSDLLKLHLQAINQNLRGLKLPEQSKSKPYTAYQIIYAETAVKIPKTMKWQNYCCDLPQENTIINKGQPICSIIAHGTNPQHLREDLHTKQHNLLQQLTKQHD